MSEIQRSEPQEVPKSNPPEDSGLSTEQLADLEDPEKQQAYRQAFLEQMKRQSCPGCGDTGQLGF